MTQNPGWSLFDLKNKVIVLTGAGGVLCSSMSRALAEAGARVAVLDLNAEAAEGVAREIREGGGQALAVACDVLNRSSVEEACRAVESSLGSVYGLVNGAGGNRPQATTGPAQSFFDLPADAVQWVFNLNFIGTLLPSQVFGRSMAASGEGVIVNISSMNAFRPLTRIPAYSAAKAAVSNFTQWLAVHLAKEYSPKIRVNAMAPGFFLTEQNRFLLTEADGGKLTVRGQSIIDHTPMQRFGDAGDLTGTLIWLLSEASAFVSGVVVPVDGGFSAFSGV